LFDSVKLHINLIDGTKSYDDNVIDKPYSDPNKTELIGDFWSGSHHRPVKGINLITLYYTDPKGKSVPVNYRIYNKRISKKLWARKIISKSIGESNVITERQSNCVGLNALWFALPKLSKITYACSICAFTCCAG